MRIRDAVAWDLAAIHAIEHRPEFHTFIGTWTMEEHAEAFANRNNCYLVIEDEGSAVAGYAILRHVWSGSIEIKRLVVGRPGNGWGRKLLKFAAQSAFGRFKAHRLYLDAYVNNARARHVYEDFGFKFEGVMREASLRDGTYFDLALMSLLEPEYKVLHGSIDGAGA